MQQVITRSNFSFRFAQDQLLESKQISGRCTPWFFPVSDDLTTICNPWEANLIVGIMSNFIAESVCSHCLPDCSNTIYHSTLTSQEFRLRTSSCLAWHPIADL